VGQQAKPVSGRSGVSEEDVARYVMQLLEEEDDSVERTIGLLGTVAEATSKAPPPAQQAITQLANLALIKQLNTDPFQQKLLTTVGGLMALKTFFGDSESRQLVEQLNQQLNALKQEIEELRRAKLTEELQQAFQPVLERVEKLSSVAEELRHRVEELERGGRPQEVSAQQSAVKELRSQFEELRDAVNTLRELAEAMGYKVVRPGAESLPDPEVFERVKEFAERFGYELRPKTVTWEEVERRIREVEERYERMLREVQEQERRRYEEKLKEDEKIAEARAKEKEAIAAMMVEGFKLLRDFLGVRRLPSLAEAAFRRAEGGELGGGVPEAQQGSPEGS